MTVTSKYENKLRFFFFFDNNWNKNDYKLGVPRGFGKSNKFLANVLYSTFLFSFYIYLIDITLQLKYFSTLNTVNKNIKNYILDKYLKLSI